jgi:hypothetical protein
MTDEVSPRSGPDDSGELHKSPSAAKPSFLQRHPVSVPLGTGIAGLIVGAFVAVALLPLWVPFPPPPPYGFPPPPPGAWGAPPPGTWGPPPSPPGTWGPPHMPPGTPAPGWSPETPSASPTEPPQTPTR